MIRFKHTKEVIGREVTHKGMRAGLVTEVRHNIPNGRLYAFVQPHNPGDSERRLPIDELEYFENK
ncbi:PRC-barrel domain-containing protein [Herminiimonas contaminans]|uniref:PRC-barrel domain-containing protein n=1 Tax=Herminiimonas contaminans TaxID=1111140 RepID=A0ABS0EQ27_9BURK|nr:PRC-barrel domain-containing protein [Herminiimonas contaminans]MBF8176941.1 PRC-barrel domain-containing protein [Herminiimonas contaminans]